MHARVRVGQQRQRIDIIRFQFGEVTKLQHQTGNLVFFRQLLQHVLGRGNRLGFTAARRRGQLQVSKQNCPQLLGRIDIEAAAREREDMFPYPLQL